MRLDEYGYPIFEDEDVLDFIYENPDKLDSIKFNDIITENTNKKAKLLVGILPQDIEAFDESLQTAFLSEADFSTHVDYGVQAYLNVKDRIFAMAQTAEEAGRMEIEFREFERRGMQKMILALNDMVLKMRMNDVVWGVGRGSSVASYVLYKIGVHRIDSLKYNLDHREFFK